MAPRISSRGFKRILIGSVSLLLLAVLALWIIDITAKRRWQSYLEDLKSRGIPNTYAEVINTDIPDEDNAAVQWERAVAESWAIPKEGPVLSDKDYAEMGRAGVSITDASRSRTAILAELEANAPFIETLRKIASCPYFSYIPKSAVQMMSQKNAGPSFPGHPHAPYPPEPRSVTQRYRFLSRAITVLAYEGETERALDLLELCLTSSRHYVQSPCTMIGFMCGTVMRGVLETGCTDALKKADISKERSKSLIGLLDPIKMRDGFRQAMNGERVGLQIQWGEILQDRRYYWKPNQSLWSEAWGRLLFSVMKAFHVNRWIEKQEKMLQFCGTLTGPTPNWPAAGKDCGFGMSLDGLVEDMFNTECRYQILRLGIASKAYRKEYGEWPIDLGALVPEYFTALPRDPFTDHSFVYETVGDSIRISKSKPSPEEENSSPSRGSRDNLAQEFAPAPI